MLQRAKTILTLGIVTMMMGAVLLSEKNEEIEEPSSDDELFLN